ncbi:MAG: hypothetical protein P9E88_13265 [Candidatus Competibacter sp.]|nr:hypothetical protein [Candidatus Competibacter sp.]
MTYQTLETAEGLEIAARMPAGQRLLFLALALVPLAAPYELLIQPRWTDYLNPFFLFAAFISAGAGLVSALLAGAALARLDCRMVFDRTRGVLSHATDAPIVPRRASACPLAAIAGLEVRVREWSDGGPSYSFAVVLTDGRELRLGSCRSRSEAEAVKSRVAGFLQQAARDPT